LQKNLYAGPSRTCPNPKSPACLNTPSQPTKNFSKQNDLSRTDKRYIGKTAAEDDATDTRLELVIAR